MEEAGPTGGGEPQVHMHVHFFKLPSRPLARLPDLRPPLLAIIPLSLFPFVCSSTFTFDTHPTIPRRHPTRRRSRTYPRGESQHRGEGFFCVLLGKVSGEREPLDKSTTRLVVVSLAFLLVATGGFFSSHFLLSSCCATKFRVL